MMSKDSFRPSLMREILKRRRFMLCMTTLVSAAYYLFTSILMIAQNQNLTATHVQENTKQLWLLRQDYRNLLGYHQKGFVAVIFFAVLLGLSCFSYLYQKEKVDFYDSQPIKKRSHFFYRYSSGFLIFFIPYAGNFMLSLLLGITVKAVTPQLLRQALGTFVSEICLFLGIYSIVILAVMLCRKMVAAILLSLFFLAAEGAYWELFSVYKQNYFMTYAFDREKFRAIFSPIYYYLYGMQKPETLILMALANIGIAAILFFLAMIGYHIRRPEKVASAILFWPVEILVKMACALAVGLTGGILVDTFFEDTHSFCQTLFTFGTILLITLLAGMLLDAMMEADLHAFLKHGKELLVMAILSAAVFAVFHEDMFGYDSYIPKITAVSSCAIIPESDGTTDDMLYANRDPFQKEMVLTNIEDVETMVRTAQEYMKKENNGSVLDGWKLTILYRMKNGKDIYRTVTVPYTIRPAIMDAVLGSEKFQENWYQRITPGDNEKDTHIQISYSSSSSSIEKTVKNRELKALNKALKIDSRKFNFTLANKTIPCGTVNITLKYRMKNGSMQEADRNYLIYSSYDHVLAYLRENGIYPADTLDKTKILSATVTGYALNTEGETAAEVTDGEIDREAKTKEIVYKDPEKLQAIADAMIPYQLRSYWTSGDSWDQDFTVTLRSTQEDTDFLNDTTEYTFLKEKVPAFVTKDFDQE